MLYYNFKNYEEFKERFGIQKHGNGEKSRKNKILLSFLKNKELLHEAVITGNFYLLHISNMSVLRTTLWCLLERNDDNLPYRVELINRVFYSSVFESDECRGICVDGDIRAVRYINHNNNDRIYKMKAGKFIRSLIMETTFGRKLPESVVTYLMEDFVQEWQVYCLRTLPENKLFVNDEFARIYDSGAYAAGDFHSCMVDKDLHSFYEDAVSAQAAYLENDEGDIVARCVIFTQVHEEESNKIWRLAERQYAIDDSSVLKRALVDALIRGNYIDGYKKVGAGCSDSRAFVDNNGNSLEEKRFYIDCELYGEDALSYQDSFKYYNYGAKKSYNHAASGWDYDLASTEGSIYGEDDEYDEGEYDDYHGYYCAEVNTVFVHGQETTCNSNDMEDFCWVDNLYEYHHADDCEFCEDNQQYALRDDCYHSAITDAYYSSEKALIKAENAHKQKYWAYAEFDDEYYEYEPDVVSYYKWNKSTRSYEEESIYVGTLINLVRNGVFHAYGDRVYNMLCHGEPLFAVA